MTTTEQIKGIVERLGALRRYLDVDAKLIEILTKKKRLLLQISGIKEAELIVRNLRNKKNGLKITISSHND
jgi:peptide chain release factor 2